MTIKSINRRIKRMQKTNKLLRLLIISLVIGMVCSQAMYSGNALAETTYQDVVVDNVSSAGIIPTVGMPEYVDISNLDISTEDKLDILTISNSIINDKFVGILAKNEQDKIDNPAPKIKDVDDEPVFKFDKVGYTNKMVDCYIEPNVKHTTLDGLTINTKLKYSKYDNDWYIAKYKNYILFIRKEDVSDKAVSYISKPAWSGDKNKSYMDYRTLTSRGSLQYKLQHIYALTDVSTGIRTVNGRYCIALGSYYTHDVGRHVDVILHNGKVLECIVGDCKADRHTIYNHSVGYNGGVCEFVVDTARLPRMVKLMGDCSYIQDWNSKVKEIRILNKNVFK